MRFKFVNLCFDFIDRTHFVKSLFILQTIGCQRVSQATPGQFPIRDILNNAIAGCACRNNMLCAKRKSDGAIVIADLELKSRGPFVCAQCHETVSLKIDKSRVNHFAHVNPLACEYVTGESNTHRRCKMEIYEALKRECHVRDVALERPLGRVRPDVSAYFKDIPVAIEVQISCLSVETIMRRTIEYHRKGIYVLWLLQWTPKLEAKRYSPQLWEKWVHAAYLGRAYYWIEKLSVACYRFEPHLVAVPKTSWYSKQGTKTTANGYTRRSKRHRTAVREKLLNLATDFIPKERLWWEDGSIGVPDAKLFTAARFDRNTE